MSTLPLLDTLLLRWREEIEATLARVLAELPGPAATVRRAMRHAVLGGGKRLRPLLSLAVCRACGGRTEDVLVPAAALELVHAYSLVRDGLPGIDGDAARGARGEGVLAPPATLELVPAYSLVHDDPPAMDDDALRRGRPTVHVVFGEA